MARRVNQTLREAWRKRIEEQQQSGRSVVEFCRLEGVSTASFHAWKRKLGIASSQTRSATGRQAESGRPRRRDRRGLAAGAAGFFELPVVAAKASPWIELALADGTVVRVPQQNTAALLTVLRALRGDLVGESREEVNYA